MLIDDVVKKCPLFKNLYKEELEYIVKKCKVVKFKSGELIFSEGEEGKDFYIVIRGEAIVSKKLRNKEIKVAALDAGDYFGEEVLIDDYQRHFTIHSQQESELLLVPESALIDTYKNKPQLFSILALNMARLLSDKLKTAKKLIVSFS